MKVNLNDQIDEKRHNLKLLRTYIDKLESVGRTSLVQLSSKISPFLDQYLVHTWERYVSHASNPSVQRQSCSVIIGTRRFSPGFVDDQSR